MHIIISIILLGIFFWLCNLAIFDLKRDWPLILIIVGICSLLNLIRRSKRHQIIRNLEKGKINVEQAEELLKQEKD